MDRCGGLTALAVVPFFPCLALGPGFIDSGSIPVGYAFPKSKKTVLSRAGVPRGVHIFVRGTKPSRTGNPRGGNS